LGKAEISINEPLLRKIVRAIEKACGEDTREHIQDNRLETNNAVPFLRGDYINDNLRKSVVNDEVMLISFCRSGWSGRIINDTANKVTYNITTKGTLAGIPKKKGRTIPHYLQSILYTENGDCEGVLKQMTLEDFGVVCFDSQDLLDDYEQIMNGHISTDDNYRHYIIAYEAEHYEITDISLQFLDKNFDTIAEYSLNEYLKPDFGSLLEPVLMVGSEPEEENNRSLISVKSGIKPKLREIEKQA